MVITTKEQRAALKRIWQRGADGRTYREIRAAVLPGSDCIMLQWAGMWLGIERDGYTHS
jgi:hypothetical protein